MPTSTVERLATLEQWRRGVDSDLVDLQAMTRHLMSVDDQRVGYARASARYYARWVAAAGIVIALFQVGVAELLK